jgi:hypothetical protein
MERRREEMAFREIMRAREDLAVLPDDMLNRARTIARRIEAGHTIAIGPPAGGLWVPATENEITGLLEGQDRRIVELVGLLRGRAREGVSHSVACCMGTLMIILALLWSLLLKQWDRETLPSPGEVTGSDD